MGLKTPLYDTHIREGAKIVDFGGWDMPLHYGSQIDEHHAVRTRCGNVRRVAHVRRRPHGRAGTRVPALSARQRRRQAQEPGQGRFTPCMLREDGGVIDDLIVYLFSESWFRMVVNAGTRAKDLAWIRAHAAGFRRRRCASATTSR